jgi:acetoin utilization protein AcuB
MLVEKRMTRDPLVVSPDQSLAEALRLTRSRRVRHLPVVEDGLLVGIVTDRDVRLAMPSPFTEPDAERVAFLDRTPVSAVMKRDVAALGPLDTVEDAARQMRRLRIGALPVVDAGGRVLGILSESDVLDAFVEILGASGASSRLEVALRDRPGELARAMRIVGEEHGINICSMMVPPARPGEGRLAVLHIATIDPRDAIATLEAAGFRVGWPSLEADLRTGGTT